MNIVVEKKNNTFYLHTKNTTYAFFVHKSGAVVHLYYGKKVDGDLLYLYSEDVYSFAPTQQRCGENFSLNTVYLEASGYNTGDFRLTSVALKNGFGAESCALRYRSYEILKNYTPSSGCVYAEKAESETLVVKCYDDVMQCEINLFYTVYSDSDVITRYTSVKNTGDTVFLTNVASGLLDFPEGDYRLLYLGGGYYYEGMLKSCEIVQGTFELSSNCGTTGHSLNPAVMVAERCAGEESGDVYSFNLLYSGNFSTQIQKNGLGQVRLVSGINPRNFSYKLQRGESFYSPEMTMCYAEGFSAASRIMHSFIRDKISPLSGEPAVLFNTWEGNYFNISQKVLLESAEKAKALGIELIVADDGWFSTRNDSFNGLGDWRVKAEKFPSGLSYTLREINGKGLLFGIWIEPEMANPSSPILNEHPDWALQIPGREHSLSRNQLVLDFTNGEVVDYIFNSIKKVFEGKNISYVKWDMNRYLTEAGSLHLSNDRQGEVFHRYVCGVYDLYRRLIAAFPSVRFEGCSGGGGRFDPAMLRLNSTVWVSDNTDAYERIKTQFGNSYFYPPSVMSVHIGKALQGFTKRSASLKFRYAVALTGVMGIEFDLKELTKPEEEELKEWIEDYKRKEPLIMRGNFYRLTAPEDLGRKCGFCYVSADRNSAFAVYLQILGETNKGRIRLKLKGLSERDTYNLSGDIDGCYTGDALMNAGLILPKIYGDGEAVIVEINKKQ